MSCVLPEGFHSIHLTPTSPKLPEFIDARLYNPIGQLPTNVLAAIDKTSLKVLMLPMHKLMYGYQCPNFPFSLGELEQPEPIPEPIKNSNRATIRLPIIPLEVPHLPSFDLLHIYLYTHDTQRLLIGLIPIVPPSGPKISDVMKTAERIGRQSNGQMLVSNCHFIHGFWTNINLLGVQDGPLWETVELAWAVALEALAWFQRTVQAINPNA